MCVCDASRGGGAGLIYIFLRRKKKNKTSKEPERTNKKKRKKMLGWARSRELITIYQVEDMSIDTLPYSGLSERIFVQREMKYYFCAVIGVLSLLREFTPR